MIFSQEEFNSRITKVKESMNKKGLEVLLTTDPSNMNYLTGYDGWSFYVPQGVILSIDEEQPFWFGRKQDSNGARITTYLNEENIFGYPENLIQSPPSHPYDFVVELFKENQRAKHYCAFLSGVINSDIKAYDYDKLPLFGIGKEKDEHFWNAIIRQCVVTGLLSKDIESYGTLKFTEAGRKFKKNPTSFLLIKERDYLVTDVDSPSSNAVDLSLDQVLYNDLVDLRKRISKENSRSLGHLSPNPWLWGCIGHVQWVGP